MMKVIQALVVFPVQNLQPIKTRDPDVGKTRKKPNVGFIYPVSKTKNKYSP
jgi:hypothetical protein